MICVEQKKCGVGATSPVPLFWIHLQLRRKWWENPKAKYQRVTLCQVSELSQFVRMDGHLMELGFKVGERCVFFWIKALWIGNCGLTMEFHGFFSWGMEAYTGGICVISDWDTGGIIWKKYHMEKKPIISNRSKTVNHRRKRAMAVK